jgi:hypothetical protein
MTLASSTASLSPMSLIWTCALGEKAMQRRSRYSCRAELDTAVRMGGPASSMVLCYGCVMFVDGIVMRCSRMDCASSMVVW